MYYKILVDKYFDWLWNGFKIFYILYRIYFGIVFFVYVIVKVFLFVIKLFNLK